ncbi:MAG: hypothetical protein ACR2RF_32210 [Geminicoccaceae bacterium]
MGSLNERALQGAFRIANGNFQSTDFIWKFGYNGDVDTAEETVWDHGGLYNYVPSPQTLSFSSTSANDAAAGTGAQTILAIGLDENFDDLQETITLNGQTAVSSVAQFSRIFRMIVVTAGSAETAAGTIYAGTGTVTAGVPAEVHARITLGENQTLMAVYTVPRNRIGLLWAASVNTGGSSSNIINARTIIRTSGGVFRTGARLIINNGTGSGETVYPIPLPALTDYEIRAAGSGPNTDVSATFEVMTIAA